MKKYLLLFIILVFSFFCLFIFSGVENNSNLKNEGKVWISISSSKQDKPRVRAGTIINEEKDLKSGLGEIGVEFKIPGFFLKDLKEKGYVVEIPECMHTGEEGAPALPAYLIKLALPPNSNVEEIVVAEDLNRPLSVQKLSIIEPYVVTPSGTKPMAYQKKELNDYYPAKIYKFQTSKLRDGNTEGTLVIYPLQYEPGYGFNLHYSLKLRIKFRFRQYTEEEKDAMVPRAWKDARVMFGRLGKINRGQRNVRLASALSTTAKGTAYVGGYTIEEGSPYLSSLIAITTWHEETGGIIKTGIKGINIANKQQQDYARAQNFAGTFGSNEFVYDKGKIYELIKKEWVESEAVVVYQVGNSDCEVAAAPLASYMNWPLLPYEGTHDRRIIQEIARNLNAKYIVVAGNISRYEMNRMVQGKFKVINLKNQLEVNLLNTYMHLNDWENGLNDSLSDSQEKFYSREISNKDFNYIYRNNQKTQNTKGFQTFSVTNPPSGGYLILYTKNIGINYENAAQVLAAYRGGEAINVSGMADPEKVREEIDKKGYKYVALMGDGDPNEVPAWDINDPMDDWMCLSGVWRDVDYQESGGQGENNGTIYSDFYYVIDKTSYDSSHGTSKSDRTFPNSWAISYYVGRVVGTSQKAVEDYITLIKKYELGLTDIARDYSICASLDPGVFVHGNMIANILSTHGDIWNSVAINGCDFTKDNYLNRLDRSKSSGVTIAYVKTHGSQTLLQTNDSCITKNDLESRKLDLQKSPFLQFSNSCLTAGFLGTDKFGDPETEPDESLCIGVDFISNGAIASIGSTMLSYSNSPILNLWADGLTTHFFMKITYYNYTVGEALEISRKQYCDAFYFDNLLSNKKKKTVWEHILIGDPAVNIQMGNEEAPGENLDDQFEENDTPQSAITISTNNYKDLVCKDDDWYKIYLSSYSDLKVTINNYDKQMGNLDLYLFNSSVDLIDQSTSGNGSEEVNGYYLTPGYYYFLVTGYNNEKNMYNMTVEASVVTPISISITNPSNGSTVAGSVDITTNPSISITNVEFYIDGSKVNTDYNAPFRYSWYSTQWADGNHIIKVIGYDAKNYSVEDSISVNVKNTGINTITCEITSPADGEMVVACLDVRVNASHSSGIKKVEFYIDNQYQWYDSTSPYYWTWCTGTFFSGEHVILVKCFSNSNLTKTDSIRINVNQVPTAKFIDLKDKQYVHGIVKIRVNAQDKESSIQHVDFKIDGDPPRFTDTEAPWEYDWDTTKETKKGSFLIELCAYDGYWCGGDSIYLKPNQLPTVNLTAPTNQQEVSGTISVQASASDDYWISKVEFYAELTGSDNPVLIGMDTSDPFDINFNTTQYADGLYIITAKAYDNINQTSVSSVPVEINNDDAPTVHITNPANEQTVSGTVEVTATAGDDKGITKVDFYIDEELIFSDTNAPYEYSWDTTGSSNGQHAVGALVFDSTNQTASDLVVVTVSNILAEPEIDIKQGTTEIPNGGSFDFGPHEVGTSTDITFTIENTGISDLILSGSPIISITDTNADQFSVQQNPSSPVLPNASSNFIIRFTPTSDGEKKALLSIINNDSDENPYNIVLWGTAGDTIKVLSPNGGENLNAGSLHNIAWSTTGTVGNVKIEFSSDNGSRWTTIASSILNDGSYSWTVPNVVSSQCLVRISEASLGIPVDISDAVFSISPEGPPQISLNRTRLYFGATTSGFMTLPQIIYINKHGSASVLWDVGWGSNWLSVSPQNGTDKGVLTISVNPNGLSAGDYDDTIVIDAPFTSNSEQNIAIYLKVYNQGATSPPFGQFSTPIDDSTVNSSIPVTGWALDDIGIESVKIYRGNTDSLVYIGDAVFIEGARPDVEQAHPDYPNNYKAGWGYMMLTNFLPNGGNGTFKIHAIATDVEGHQVTLGTKTITVDNANAVKPFGAIDTPKQGGIADGNSYRNNGWVLTPQPNTIPTDGSTINVYVDGVYLGHPTYNVYRPDVASLFPGYNNSNGAHAYFDFDTTAYYNGVHTIHWIAQDNAGNTDGIGSRFFTIQNVGGSRAKSTTTQMIRFSLPQISELPLDFSNSIRVKQGYGKHIESRIITPNDKGIVSITIKELDRIEIELADMESEVTGCLLVEKRVRPLPIGSSIKNGAFYWTPMPGFLGDYRLLFVVKDQNGNLRKIDFLIRIEPKFGRKK